MTLDPMPFPSQEGVFSRNTVTTSIFKAFDPFRAVTRQLNVTARKPEYYRDINDVTTVTARRGGTMTKRAGRTIAVSQTAAPKAAGPASMDVVTTNGQTHVELRPQNLKEIGGSEATGFNFWILKAALNVRAEAKWMTDADKSQQVSAIIQALRGFAPMDEIEGMMASQAVALHIGVMECLRRAALPEQSFEVAQGLRKQAANLSRAYMELVAALDRRRGKGMQQVVRVERVQIEAGGQAIVGNLTAGGPRRPTEEGVGDVAQNEGEPYAPPTRLAHDPSIGAVVSPVWSEGADDRKPLPVTSHE